MAQVLQLLTTPDDRVGFALLALVLGYLALAVLTRGPQRARPPQAAATPPSGPLHG